VPRDQRAVYVDGGQGLARRSCREADVLLFLLLLIVAVALGVIGALARGTLYLLITGVMALIADLVLLRTRMGRSRRPRVR
jgi:hypothetical protein